MELFTYLLALLLATVQLVFPDPLKVDFEKQVVAAIVYPGGSFYGYLVNVTVGTPPQAIQLFLDTGSGFIWVYSSGSTKIGCPTGSYDTNASSTFAEVLPDAFNAAYLPGSVFTGDWISDAFGIGGATIPQFTLGLVNNVSFLTPAPNQTNCLYPIAGISIFAEEIDTQKKEGAAVLYTNIVAALKKAGLIDSYAFSLYLDDWGSKTGSIVFGGVDTAKYHGDLITVPVASFPSTKLQTAWAVMLDGVSLADASGTVKVAASNLSSYALVDSGTSFAALPPAITTPLNAYVGAVLANSSCGSGCGLLAPCSLGTANETLQFTFSGNGTNPTIGVSLSQFVLLPQGVKAGVDMCVWGLSTAGPNGPVILGDSFLSGVYVLFDLEDEEIGFAMPNFNVEESNLVSLAELKAGGGGKM